MKLFLDRVFANLDVPRPFVLVVGWMTKDDGTRIPNSTRLWMFFSPRQIKSFRYSHEEKIHVAQHAIFEEIEANLEQTFYDREAESLLLTGVHAETFASIIVEAVATPTDIENTDDDDENDENGGNGGRHLN